MLPNENDHSMWTFAIPHTTKLYLKINIRCDWLNALLW